MTSRQKIIFLLRHTQTTWNTLSRYQGRIDTELSPSGETAIERLARGVTPGMFDVVYASPLSRALRLAEALARRAEASLVSDDRLTEIAMGPWEGLTRAEIEDQFGDMIATWHDRPDLVEFPGGETIQHVAARVEDFMEELFANEAYESLAVVAHDAVVKVALMCSLGLELRYLHRFRVANGSVSVLRGRRYRGSVESVNVTSHLTGSPFVLPP